ncbi:unnamed protein product, partial [Phaeothamnion confervicola]
VYVSLLPYHFLHASSLVRFFKNGADQGPAFQGITPGTYYPAVSLYMGFKVRVNFGPKFVCPPRGVVFRWKPVSERRPF